MELVYHRLRGEGVLWLPRCCIELGYPRFLRYGSRPAVLFAPAQARAVLEAGTGARCVGPVAPGRHGPRRLLTSSVRLLKAARATSRSPPAVSHRTRLIAGRASAPVWRRAATFAVRLDGDLDGRHRSTWTTPLRIVRPAAPSPLDAPCAPVDPARRGTHLVARESSAPADSDEFVPSPCPSERWPGGRSQALTASSRASGHPLFHTQTLCSMRNADAPISRFTCGREVPGDSRPRGGLTPEPR